MNDSCVGSFRIAIADEVMLFAGSHHFIAHKSFQVFHHCLLGDSVLLLPFIT